MMYSYTDVDRMRERSRNDDFFEGYDTGVEEALDIARHCMYEIVVAALSLAELDRDSSSYIIARTQLQRILEKSGLERDEQPII